MDAEILPRHDLAAMPPDDKILAEHPDLKDLAFRQVAGAGNHVPVID